MPKLTSRVKHVAVLGTGGRESAFVETLLSDPQVETISVFEFNAGFVTEPRVKNVPVSVSHQKKVVEYCQKNKVDLVMIGPEQVQVDGMGEVLRKVGIPVFGASKRASVIESDKAWARAFMTQLNLPQPEYLEFSEPKKALKAAQTNHQLKVVKATGLASGKGVIVCDTTEEVAAALQTILTDKKFGAAGETILLEERLGWKDQAAQEVSVMFYSDGTHLLPLPLAQDYKREFDGDQGQNTGGMGTYISRTVLKPEEQIFVQEEIAQPLIDALKKDKRPFVGILYIGLMKTANKRHNPYGLFIIEINSRGGDPETVVQLAGQTHPQIAEFYRACAQGDLTSVEPPTFKNFEYVDVVLAAPSYPDGKSQNEVITGLEATETEADNQVKVIHAGTTYQSGQTLTNGGRILNIVGTGKSLVQARNRAYERVEMIRFGKSEPKYRHDIAQQKTSSTAQICVVSLVADPRLVAKNKVLTDLNRYPTAVLTSMVDVYTIKKSLTSSQLQQTADILHNPVWQEATTNSQPTPEEFSWVIEIGYLPGVTDNVAHTVKSAMIDSLKKTFADDEGVWTSQLLFLSGKISAIEAQRIAQAFANPLIQRISIKKADQFKQDGGMDVIVPQVKLTTSNQVLEVNLEVSDEELMTIGKLGVAGPDGTRRGALALDLAYLKTIQAHYRELGRNPTDIELESIAQTWSEHCKHTIFADPIDELQDGLFRTYIKRATERIRKHKGARDQTVSVFTDNSGALAFDDEYLVTDKVETHNSPSALDPFGGSITGIVGVNRDALGFGLGAKPILNRYGFCFTQPGDMTSLYRDADQKQPLLSAKWIMDGVIAGVNSGGNCSGIPSPQGFLYFDSRYRGKPLVFVGTVGLIPRQVNGSRLDEKQARPGDYVVVIGGRVGLDGIHGATFSSETLSTHSPVTAVQIGDPITQKKLSDALVKEARDLGLYTSITDNGAGGLSCSVAEMAKESGGFSVDLDQVLVKYPGLDPWQVWISESQERMTLSVPPANWPEFEALMKRHDVEASVIGTFTDTGRCEVFSDRQKIMDLEMQFLHDGLPPRAMNTVRPQPALMDPTVPDSLKVSDMFMELLARPSVASTAFVSQQFDHEVQATSALKPLQGRGRVNADATAIRPRPESHKGVVVSQALYPSYSEIDAYHMAACSIDAAIRNLVTVGVNPDVVALLDNFCWCSSTEPERLYQLKEAARACYDLAVAYGTPFISGKDSMFNDFKGFDEQGQPVKISVPPTLLVSSLAVIDDVRLLVSLDAKAAGDIVYVLGQTKEELGGSELYRLLAEKDSSSALGTTVPEVDILANAHRYQQYHKAINEELIASAVSLGRGGLAAALTKTCLGGLLGVKVTLKKLPGEWETDVGALFSETQGRILVTVPPQSRTQFESLFQPGELAEIGQIQASPVMNIEAKQRVNNLQFSLDELKAAYFSTSPSTHQLPQGRSVMPSLAASLPKTLVLTGYGINCEEETAFAFGQAGSSTQTIHINDLIAQPSLLKSVEILAIPGGFSFGDDTGSGNAFAQKLKNNLWPEIEKFVEGDHLVIGICNGCQILSNLGLLPVMDDQYGQRSLAFIHNDNALYTDRWVDLNIEGQGPWLTGLTSLTVPIAHGEGKVYASPLVLGQLEERKQVAARYVHGEMCRHFQLEANPNGSAHNIAAATDPSGRVLGIMPHPERSIHFTQLPHWTYLKSQYQRQGLAIPEVGPGLELFQNAVKYFTA